MTWIARLIGFGLLQSLATRIPPLAGFLITLGLVLVGDLLPILPLLAGTLRMSDLLVYYSLAMWVGIFATVVRLRTVVRPTFTDRNRMFFQLHYIILVGSFALAATGMSIAAAALRGLSGGWWSLVPMVAALLLGTAWRLADGWFTQGARFNTPVILVILPGYLILGPMLGAAIVGLVMTLTDNAEGQRWTAIGLVLAQTAVDLGILIAAGVRALRAGSDRASRP